MTNSGPYSANLSAQSNLEANAKVTNLLTAASNLATSIGYRTTIYDNILYATKYAGNENAPQDIKRLRRQVHDMMRRMGQPVIIKKMLTVKDVEENYAERSANYDSIYGQTRNNDNLSWGIGFVSKEKSDNEWIDPSTGEVVRSDYAPNDGWPKAPKYRGFGPGILTYVIQPDMAEDFFKLTPEGAMFQTQTAELTMGWFPKIDDNDLIINVELGNNGRVVAAGRRYQAKIVNPVTMRGLDNNGRIESKGYLNNRHTINQKYQMTLVPVNNILMNVEVDR